MMILRQHCDLWLLLFALLLSLTGTAYASLGDRLPEFRQCVSVRRTFVRFAEALANRKIRCA